MDRFKLSAKDIKEGMAEVTEASVHWWAYLYWMDELKDYEESLRNALDDEQIGFFRYCVVEAKRIIVELYEKLIKMPEFSEGVLSKPDWMDEFMTVE